MVRGFGRAGIRLIAPTSETLTRLIPTLTFFITFHMAIGAVFGALNTMFSAVVARTRGIATPR